MNGVAGLHSPDTGSKASLWRRWVVANSIAEAVGLGLTLGLTGFLLSRLDAMPGETAVVLSLFSAVLSGAIEATIVGLGQWWAMAPWFPRIKRFAWWLATLVGALAAYVLGYLPSTIISMSQTITDAPATVAEPPQRVVLLMAAGLGLVAGAVLSFAQFLVLRGKVSNAGRWIPANMLAWAIGMPIIFGTIDQAIKLPEVWQTVSLMVLALLGVGAIVGGIHGAVLVTIAGTQSSSALKAT